MAVELEKNKLFITVIEARDLIAADIGGSSDPYVKIKDVDGLSGKGGKTSTKKKTTSPTWNESFEFDFSYKLTNLRFKVFDHDTFSEDDLLGKVAVNIALLYDGQEHDVWLQLQMKKNGVRCLKGELRLKLRAQWKIPVAPIGVWLPIPAPVFTLGLGWGFSKKTPAVDLDASVVALDAGNQTLSTVSFRSRTAFDGAINHQGDNRTGEGSGDDERVVIDLSRLPPTVAKLVFVVNSFTGAPLTSAKSAYLRLMDASRTLAFMRLEYLTPTTGLFFGYMLHTPAGWYFQTIARGVDGRVVADSMSHIAPLLNANAISGPSC